MAPNIKIITPVKPKRVNRTVQQRFDMINKIDQHGWSNREAARHLEMSASGIQKLLAARSAISERMVSAKTATTKRLVQPKYDLADRATFAWFAEARTKNFIVTGDILKAKALQYAQQLHPNSNFAASDGWLQSFKERYDIRFRDTKGAENLVSEKTVEQWQSKLDILLKRYTLSEIYNTDETALFWRSIPTRSYVMGKESGKASIPRKDRITILFTCNATGDDKLMPVVVHSAQNPHCFKKAGDRGVRWYKSKRGWMTASIFADWLTEIDKKFGMQKKKILLLMDNARQHYTPVNLKNVEIVYLPANTTSKLQPLDAGIIRSFKAHYKRRMIEKIINVMPTCNNQEEVLAKLNLYDAIQMLKLSWAAVTCETIQNCYGKVGVRRLQNESDEMSIEAETTTSVDEVDALAQLLQSMGSDLTANEYFDLEDGEDVSDDAENDVNDEAIIAFVSEGNDDDDSDNQENDQDSDDDNSVELVEPASTSGTVTDEQVLQALTLVQKYMSQNPSLRTITIDELSHKVALKKVGRMKQKKITDYLPQSATNNADSEEDIDP